MTNILDFLYLDLKRLESFASQLFSGIPDATTKESGQEMEFGIGVKGGIPAILQGSGNTKAVLSAGSTVTSRVHHFLVSRVLDELKHRELLMSDPNTADDGAFVLLDGRLQVVDPLGLAAMLRMLSPMMQTLSQLQQEGESSQSTSGSARRQLRQQRQQEQQSVAAQAKQFDALADVTEAFGRETVRIRVLVANDSRATAVAERDKFVEPLERLVLRHGYLTGGHWMLLGQVNVAGSSQFFEPQGETFLDLLEKTGIAALHQIATVSAGTDVEWTLTPLAIYREVRGGP